VYLLVFWAFWYAGVLLSWSFHACVGWAACALLGAVVFVLRGLLFCVCCNFVRLTLRVGCLHLGRRLLLCACSQYFLVFLSSVASGFFECVVVLVGVQLCLPGFVL